MPVGQPRASIRALYLCIVDHDSPVERFSRVPCDIEQSDPFIGMQHSSAQSDANAADYDFMLQR